MYPAFKRRIAQRLMELMPLAQGVLVPPGVDDPYDYELLGYHSSETNQFAFTGEGLDELGERIEKEFERTLQPIELMLPFSEGGRLAELHHVAGDLEREDTPAGVRVRARVPATVAERFAPYAVAERNGAGPLGTNGSVG